jgi:hypothetical protein
LGTRTRDTGQIKKAKAEHSDGIQTENHQLKWGGASKL